MNKIGNSELALQVDNAMPLEASLVKLEELEQI